MARSSLVFDLIAVIAVVICLILPKPSLSARPAVEEAAYEPIELDRLAALEDAHFADPSSVDRAIDLADEYLSLLRPGWALSTLAPYV